tara:strand:- start:1293 stop:1445 length:153 start_codon:yes stop_codon:yes gene_type:complete
MESKKRKICFEKCEKQEEKDRARAEDKNEKRKAAGYQTNRTKENNTLRKQ